MIVGQPTIKQLVKMMEFCNEYSFVIPSYNLVLPEEATGSNFRSSSVFRLLRSGFMTYSGFGGANKRIADINIGGIPLPQQWIDRAYIFLSEQVKLKTKEKAVGWNMKHIPELLLKFGGCDFIQLGETK